MALPTVGTKALHTVQLTPELRRILERRARRAAKREYAPVLAADRGAFGAANNAFRTEAASARGANSIVENALGHALAGLASSGLKGGYLRQTRNALAHSAADNASALPFLLAEAKENRSKALGEARQALTSDRASMLQSAAAAGNQLLKEARTAGSQRLKEAENRRRTARHKEAEERGEGGLHLDPQNLQNARLALKSALTKWAENPEVEVNGEKVHLKEVNPLRTTEDWRRFGVELEKEFSGFDLAEINHVINQLLQNRQQKEHEGRLPQPGVPGAGRG